MSTTPEKRLVLIADDRPASRELLRLVLERAGYAVIEAEDGNQALDQTRSGNPDLVLMDLQMPGLDGYEVLAALRSDPRFTTLPVLALTASAMRGDRENILAAGFTDYLAKPAGPELLRETVARLLDEAAESARRRA
ncbi:MAG TPA: response regulator [Acidobacteriaceae bacterium]|jgi:CheY-like chemotaxis protein|nr:response regulator [Acidobacteriaceae bacterium]